MIAAPHFVQVNPLVTLVMVIVGLNAIAVAFMAGAYRLRTPKKEE
jgi:hypothetical protein